MSKFRELCNTPSDINEHLPILAALASECHHVTEMGTRYIVSTWAFLEGLSEGDTLVAIDFKHPREYNGSIILIENAASKKGVNFTFKEEDTRENEVEETDLLFIDTNHTYTQLTCELSRHSGKARKYLVFHDTESCRGELQPALDELAAQGVWKLHTHYPNNNGVTVYSRV